MGRVVPRTGLKGRAQTTRQPRRGIRSRKNLEVGNKNFTRLKFDFAQLLIFFRDFQKKLEVGISLCTFIKEIEMSRSRKKLEVGEFFFSNQTNFSRGSQKTDFWKNFQKQGFL